MFVDIHNHILPGIDDGARSVRDSLQMARLAVADGTDTMVATPHRVWAARKTPSCLWLREAVQSLQKELDAAKIALKVLPGLEIPLGPHVGSELASGTLMTLGDAGRYALIEPPFDRIPHDGLENLQRVLEAGFQIVLAHPERNAEIQHSLFFVEACADLGITFQLTTGSILGRFGPHAQRTAEAILAHQPEWQIVISSDSHDLSDRSPGLMRAARDAAALLVGESSAHEMVDSRPRSLIAL